MKRGGRVIYGGKLGKNSEVLINYFQVSMSFFSINITINKRYVVLCESSGSSSSFTVTYIKLLITIFICWCYSSGLIYLYLNH